MWYTQKSGIARKRSRASKRKCGHRWLSWSLLQLKLSEESIWSCKSTKNRSQGRLGWRSNILRKTAKIPVVKKLVITSKSTVIEKSRWSKAGDQKNWLIDAGIGNNIIVPFGTPKRIPLRPGKGKMRTGWLNCFYRLTVRQALQSQKS